MIRGLLVFGFVPLYMLLASLVGYPIARVLGSPALLYTLGRFGVRVGLRLAGTKVVLEGREKLGDPANTVVMANHVSFLDAPLLFEAFGIDFKAVVKKEIFRFPFFGACLRFAGFIEVDRADRAQSTAAIGRAAESLRKGACFLIFPEGTRTQSGELGEFRKGAFVVAIDAGSRIVPVALSGLRERLPRGGFRISPGVVHVKVLDPFDAGSYSYDERDRLIAEVRGRIAGALAGEDS